MSITICIATYGSDEWRDLALSRALPSAEAQEPTEILIGHQTDGTVASSRNGLAERATSEWLLYLDADDELGPGFVQAMQRALEQVSGADGTPPLLSPLESSSRRGTARRGVEGQGGAGHFGVPPLLTPAVSYVTNGRKRPPRFLPGTDLRKNNFLVVGTLVNRDLFLEVGGFPEYEHGFEDFGLWSKCYRLGAQIVRVKRAVYIAHINPQSKHRVGWRDRRWQVAMHQKVERELDAWEEDYKWRQAVKMKAAKRWAAV